MAGETPEKSSGFSDRELSLMRQEVLRWIERDKRRRAKTTGGATPNTAPRQPRRSPVGQESGSTPPQQPAPEGGGAKGRPPQQRQRQEQSGRTTRVAPPMRVAPHAGPMAMGVNVRGRPKKNLPRRRVLRFPLVAFGLMAIASLGILAALLSIYVFGWSGRPVYWLSRFFPLPAVYADEEVLRLEDYLEALRLHEAMYRRAGKPVDITELRRQVVARFIDRVTMERLATRLGVTVPPSEVDRQLQLLTNQAGSPSQFNTLIDRTFPGWTVADFRSALLEPYLLRQAIYGRVWNDPRSWQQAEAQAQKIRQQIATGGITFSQAAVQFSQAVSADAGGDTGYRTVAELEPAVQAAIAVLEPGQISVPVRTSQGFLLLEQMETVGEAADRRYRHREILIPPTVNINNLLAAELARIRVRRLVPQ